LDRTLEGITEGPAHWEERMLDISLRTAERLFQRVIEENVDFLVLSGNVCNIPLAPPGILLFLVEAFERLHKAGIAVYWAGGEYDSPEDWTTAFTLPENVHFFPSNSIQEYYFQRTVDSEKIPVAKIVGMSRNQQRKRIRSSEFPYDPSDIFTIAVANGEVEAETLSQRRMDYWALGGASKRSVFHGNPRKKGPDGKPLRNEPAENVKRDKKDLPPQPYIVHYPGQPLARTPQDIGTFGATLVEVPLAFDESKSNVPCPVDEPVLTYFSTSPIRWLNDTVTLSATDDGGKLADELRLRMKNYRDNQKADHLFINWFVDIPMGTLASQLRRGALVADLLSELRAMYGQDDPLTWSVSISVLVPERLSKEQYEQQTITGDFLRSIEHFQNNGEEIVHLEKYVPNNFDADVAKTLLLADYADDEITAADDKMPKQHWLQTQLQAETQHRILSEAAVTGAMILGKE
jgi:DNA repair exonuclease SbcCD nuclease subunit